MIICLNGPPRVGKTTVADILVQKGAIKLDLTFPFRKFVQEVFELDDHEFQSRKDDSEVFGGRATIRDIQIDVANACERGDPNIWVWKALCTINPSKYYVLDSIGKRSQWRWIKKNAHDDLVMWRINDADRSKYKEFPDLFIDGREGIKVELNDSAVTEFRVVSNDREEVRNSNTLESFMGKIEYYFSRLKSVGIENEIQKKI